MVALCDRRGITHNARAIRRPADGVAAGEHGERTEGIEAAGVVSKLRGCVMAAARHRGGQSPVRPDEPGPNSGPPAADVEQSEPAPPARASGRGRAPGPPG